MGDLGAAIEAIDAANVDDPNRFAGEPIALAQGRPGYLTWAILAAEGIEPATVARACTIVTKAGLGSDPEVQTFEDAVCLTFLQTQLTSTIDKVHDDDHMVAVIAKTLTKMTDAGKAAALTIELDPHGAELVGRALELPG